MTTEPAVLLPFAYPDMRDPRVMLCIPAEDRAAMTSLWALVERLLTIVATAREPMLAQIKLVWWRDMLLVLADDPDGLPLGEPLLADLRRDWGGSGELVALATHIETLLLAEDDAEAVTAATAMGSHVFAVPSAIVPDQMSGARWGLVAAAAIQPGTAQAAAMLAQAAALPRLSRGAKGHGRACAMLDRWASQIAQRGGDRSLRMEALLLLRIGLFGR